MPGRRISAVFATDNYETIRPVFERMRKQTIRDEIEIVLVAHSTEAAKEALKYRDEFAGVVIVEDPVYELAVARAKGVRAASAPLVFIGETHAYPHPGMSEKLANAMEEGWAAVAPGFGNANPKGTLSWSGFLCDYARWGAGLPGGEIDFLPSHNVVYRRSVLVSFGERLVHALSLGDGMMECMREGQHRFYHEPSARIDHVNTTMGLHWLMERFVVGVLVSSRRAVPWSFLRRLGYVAGSPLIPLVLLWRIMPGIREATRHAATPPGTIATSVLATVIRVTGEFFGYAGFPIHRADRRMHEYELHRLAYLAPGKS
ncbi:MAG: glycosyltransferase family 2 protein [Acidimicrobiia bacterium]|nr:glycosyltransferase family 2 protein [Acidimicrobiia bacterium]